MARSKTARRKTKKIKNSSVETTPEPTTEQKFAIFSVGKEMFGIDLDMILETLYTYHVIPVEHLPETYKGIIKLKGKSIPVVMLRELLNEDTPVSSMQVCIIIRVGDSRVGLLVDSDIEIIPSTTGTLHALPDCYSRDEAEFITNILWLEQSFIGILDCRRMMEILAGWKEEHEAS